MTQRSESTLRKNATRRRNRDKRKRRLLVEGLEQRQLLAGGGFLPGGVLPTDFDGPRNVGTVQAFGYAERELSTTRGANDTINTAELVPLGNGAGQRDTIDLTGSLIFGNQDGVGFRADVDVYAFQLQAGDILDISAHEGARSYTLFYPTGSIWYGVDDVQSTLMPEDSPIQTSGNATFAQVVPADGTYYLEIPANNATQNYTLGLRTYRPVTEQLPIGSEQIVYLDFNGGTFTPDVFNTVIDPGGAPLGGVVRIDDLQQLLPILGVEVENDAVYNAFLDDVVAQVKDHFAALGINGNNGDNATTGRPGEFGITFLDSRFDPDPGVNPLVTRVLTFNGADFPEIPSAIANVIDLGNFSLDDTTLILLEQVVAEALTYPLSGSASQVDVVARNLSTFISHELGHVFGLRHTDGSNDTASMIDTGGVQPGVDFYVGVGDDGIFGTLDDTEIDFATDRFDPAEGLYGTQQAADTLSHVLSSGAIGSSITGRVFDDINGDGVGTSDPGIADVTVFLDTDGDGLLDPNETRTQTGQDGTFTLPSGNGTFTVAAIAPSQFVGTGNLAQTVSGGASNIELGFRRVANDITGTKFSDDNGNGFRDPGEEGIEGVYIYLDLDRDQRPDLGEPSATTGPDGSYTLNFPPIASTYAIREIAQAGFELTSPQGGEFLVQYDGSTITGVSINGVDQPGLTNGILDFANQPSRDFGDAPATYGDASHGILAGLSIGSIVDRESASANTADATGDDTTGDDDEDGFTALKAFGPGSSDQFEVTVTNTTGRDAYFQGFVDLDRSGTFTASEQVISDRLIPSGSINLPLTVSVSVPAGLSTGESVARFRISQTAGLGATGFASTGEVEDHQITILSGSDLANDDVTPGNDFNVARNSLSNRLDVLRNDFDSPANPLRITNVLTSGSFEGTNINTVGSVRIADDDGGRSIIYVPQNGFVGLDRFVYQVEDAFGNTGTALVQVNVTFESAQPVAVDDIFIIPENSVSRPLNVLDNDVSSAEGGLQIISVTPGTAGGSIEIVGNGQSIRYTPRAGFNGTEQFTYSIQDGAAQTSNAQVTLKLSPGTQAQDAAAFIVDFVDPLNGRPITNLQLNDGDASQNRFGVRVSVDDLGTINLDNPEGLASAFVDLLYTDELVKTIATAAGSGSEFPFVVSFGALFDGETFQQGNSQTPGLIDDIGGVQLVGNATPHTGPVELFTITFEALSPGVAVFATDPADELESETVLIGSDEALTPSQLRFGRREFVIFPGSDNFVAAVDDAFMNGLDSQGNVISQNSTASARLDVLANDRFAGTTLQSFSVVQNAGEGSVTINNAGTPNDLSDDFINYRPAINAGASGFDSFTYVIVTDTGFRSTAEVTLAYDSANDNDLIAIDLSLVNAAGLPITGNQISAGEEFGVQINVEDLRANAKFVFAAFADILYNSNLLTLSPSTSNDGFDFRVEFGPNFNAEAAVGTGRLAGIIDEFGTLSVLEDEAGAPNPDLLAKIYFQATAATSTPTTITASPADSSPFQDSLLFDVDDPIEKSRIRYGAVSFTISAGAEGESPLRNPRLAADVNNDGHVSPIDALHIVNAMQRNQSSNSAEGESLPITSYYVDVNGDRSVTALDALNVINYLNVNSRRGSQLSGEQIVAVDNNSQDKAAAKSNASASDAIFAEVSGDQSKLASFSTQQETSQAVVSMADNDDSDSGDDTDVLDLLADDVSRLW